MRRKILALLLLPCVLMSQSAVFGHAHGGSEPAGHGLCPHVHIGGTPHGHAHPHKAADGHHHHHHGDGRHDHDDGGPHPDSDSRPVTPSDHDSDAVYISGVDAVSTSRVAVELEFPELLAWGFDSTSPPDAFTAVLSGDAERWATAPPLRGPSCPLYLRQLTLLI